MRMNINKTIKENYLSYKWETVKAYDERMRVLLSADTQPDPFYSDDERTFHLVRLTHSARISGDRKYIDLLLSWFEDHRFAEWTRLQATILVSVVFATFYRTALQLFERILASPSREWIIRGMCDDQVMFLSYGRATPFFCDSVACRLRDLFCGNKPWVSTEQLYQEAREGFISQVRAHYEKNEGGWEADSANRAVPSEGVFFSGQFFDGLVPLQTIVSNALREIILIDGYTDTDTLAILSGKANNVAVCVLTKSVTPALRISALAFNKQYHGLSIRTSQAFHDRFLIVDGTDFYHIGASIKDLAKRAFMYSRIHDPGLRTALWQQWSAEWNAAGVVI